MKLCVFKDLAHPQVISLQKVDSLLVFEYNREVKKVFARSHRWDLNPRPQLAKADLYLLSRGTAAMKSELFC
jgi:hypothetical protein